MSVYIYVCVYFCFSLSLCLCMCLCLCLCVGCVRCTCTAWRVYTILMTSQASTHDCVSRSDDVISCGSASDWRRRWLTAAGCVQRSRPPTTILLIGQWPLTSPPTSSVCSVLVLLPQLIWWLLFREFVRCCYCFQCQLHSMTLIVTVVVQYVLDHQ